MIKRYAPLLLTMCALLFLSTLFSCTQKQTIQAKQTNNTIISMSPATTTILLSLGLGDSLIAVDSWSALKENTPKGIPSFDMMNPDVEALMALQATTILVSTMTQAGTGKDPFKPLSLAGTRVVYIPTSESIEDIYTDISSIAELFGKQTDADLLIDEMKKYFSQAAQTLQSIEEKKPLRVYFEISPAPYLYTFGSGVYLNELLEIALLSNIFELEKGWIAVSAEAVVSANPDIIFTNTSFSDNPVEEILSRKGWEGIRAVQNKRVYYLTPEYTSEPSSTVVLALAEIMEAIYHTSP